MQKKEGAGMAVQIGRMTVEAFDEFAELPENADKLLEYIAGEVVEVPSNAYASEISGVVFGELYIFLKGKNWGHLMGEAGGYMVSGERYAPDVAFISKAKQMELARKGYNPNPPDLAVEVDSPSTLESQENLGVKVVNYLAAGTVVWVFKPEKKRVEVYVPGQPVRILGVDDVLEGGDVLPGFTLAIKDIFRDEKMNNEQ
jgi:Uma2 family endonuclease